MNKARILLYLAIGNLSGALLYNPPARAWDLASWVTDSINGAYASLTTRPDTQTPLPVPQVQPPIGNAGNTASIQPCAAPPLATPVATRTVEAVPSVSQPTVRHDGLKDRRAKILLNLAPNQQIVSIYRRLNSPDGTDLVPADNPGGIDDFYQTSDGLVRVRHKNGLVVSIQIVPL